MKTPGEIAREMVCEPERIVCTDGTILWQSALVDQDCVVMLEARLGHADAVLRAGDARETIRMLIERSRDEGAQDARHSIADWFEAIARGARGESAKRALELFVREAGPFDWSGMAREQKR